MPSNFPYAIRAPQHPFRWKQLEQPVSARFRDSVIRLFRARNLKQFPETYFRSRRFDSAFHFADLNGDGRLDFIYEGWTGSDGEYVEINLNQPTGFHSVFKDNMRVIDIRFDKQRVSYLVIYNWGCCDAYVEFERHFSVDSLFRTKLITQRAIMAGMGVKGHDYVQPEGFFDRPVKFKVLNKDYALRSAPVIQDTPLGSIGFDTALRTKGNILAQYPKGSLGVAWAYKKDNTGREWWLVEMDPVFFMWYNLFYDQDDEHTHYYGWMSSRFVEKLP